MIANVHQIKTGNPRTLAWDWSGGPANVRTHEYSRSIYDDGLCFDLLPLDAPSAYVTPPLKVPAPDSGRVRVLTIEDAFTCGGDVCRVVAFTRGETT